MAELSSQLAPIVGLTLSERVYSTIKDAILNLGLKPGTPLVEDELARQLGTSKTPVRDALVALERDGLVVKMPYKGTYVAELSLRDAKEIFELRAVLEGLAARLAVGNFTAKDLEDAEQLLNAGDEARRMGHLDDAAACGAKFHHIILMRADNRRLVPLLRNLEDQLQRLRLMSAQREGRLEKSAHEHRRVLAALREGDPGKVEAAMRHHLHSVLLDYQTAPGGELAGLEESDRALA